MGEFIGRYHAVTRGSYDISIHIWYMKMSLSDIALIVYLPI